MKNMKILKTAMLAFENINDKKMTFIFKLGFEDSVKIRASEEETVLLEIDDLFKIRG